MKKIILLITIFTLSTLNVFANTCDNKEIVRLQNLAKKVKVSHEVSTTEATSDDNFVYINEKIFLNIFNITDDLLIKITSDIGDNKYVIKEEIAGSKYSFDTGIPNAIVKYNIEIYSNDFKCGTSPIRTISYTKPKKNLNYGYVACRGNEEIPICQKYVTTNIGMETWEVQEYIEKYKKSRNITTKNEEKPSTNNFFTKNKIYIIAGTGVILTLGIIFVINKNRGKL